MTLSKANMAQEEVPTSQSGYPTTKGPELAKERLAKINPEIARSALSGDPADVPLVTNNSIFIKWP